MNRFSKKIMLCTSFERSDVDVFLRLPRPRFSPFPRPIRLLLVLRIDVLLLLTGDSSSSVDVSAATICKPLSVHCDNNISSGTSVFAASAVSGNVNDKDSSSSS